MKINVKKEIIICIISLVMLAITMTQTFANNTITDANQILNLVSNKTNQLSNENASDIPTGVNRNNTVNNTTKNNTTNNTTRNNTVNNTSKNNTTKNNANNSNKNELPDTGLDTPSIAIVAICVISAIYAYKKVRDYNNI